jgi:hypothetical protein
MVRKQVYIEPEQDDLLKRRAAELGVTESELIRWGIGQLARVPATTYLDDIAWQRELDFMRKRGRLKPLGRKRTWTREELYEDRLGRFSR